MAEPRFDNNYPHTPPCRRARRRRSARTLRAAALSLAMLGAAGWCAAADGPAEFRGADLALGSKLIREHRCTECHVGKVGGDGSAIYRPAGRINSPAALLAMVELCSTELKLQLFPEDVAAVAAVLQRDHYRFK